VFLEVLQVRYKFLVETNQVGGKNLMPEVGDMAPDFELKSHLEKDKTVKLSDFRGKKNVVLAFYPLAWTPV
jgi:peroxiredoxin